jgi:hypothetical protein
MFTLSSLGMGTMNEDLFVCSNLADWFFPGVGLCARSFETGSIVIGKFSILLEKKVVDSEPDRKEQTVAKEKVRFAHFCWQPCHPASIKGV